MFGKQALRNLGNLLFALESALIKLRDAMIKWPGVHYEKVKIFAL